MFVCCCGKTGDDAAAEGAIGGLGGEMGRFLSIR